MHVRVSMERDTFLRRGAGNSPCRARQIWPRERGHLSQSSSRVLHSSRLRSPASDTDQPARVTKQDQDCINVFRPYFWIVYDSQDVRKRLPEQSAQLRVHVADLPRSNGNVGIEEMTRGLGLSTTENNNNDAPREPQAASEEEAPKNDSDASEGYKTLDVRVEWARTFLSFCPYTLE